MNTRMYERFGNREIDGGNTGWVSDPSTLSAIRNGGWEVTGPSDINAYSGMISIQRQMQLDNMARAEEEYRQLREENAREAEREMDLLAERHEEALRRERDASIWVRFFGKGQS